MTVWPGRLSVEYRLNVSFFWVSAFGIWMRLVSTQPGGDCFIGFWISVLGVIAPFCVVSDQMISVLNHCGSSTANLLGQSRIRLYQLLSKSIERKIMPWAGRHGWIVAGWQRGSSVTHEHKRARRYSSIRRRKVSRHTFISRDNAINTFIHDSIDRGPCNRTGLVTGRKRLPMTALPNTNLFRTDMALEFRYHLRWLQSHLHCRI